MPQNDFRQTRVLFLRLLGLTTLVAAASFWAQARGLIGPDGIWPLADTVEGWKQTELAWWLAPTLARILPARFAADMLCGATCLAATGVMLGVRPRICLAVAWLAWTSLLPVAGPFLQFQWDILLSETLFWAIFYAPEGGTIARPEAEGSAQPSRWSRWVLIVLAFKVTFCSGLVKLLSGDEAWRNGSALAFHFWTQPLPTWTAYYAHQLPESLKNVLCLLMFVVELPVACLVFGPRPLRLWATAALVALQMGLGLSGNYSYFTLLTLVVYVPLLDDRAIGRLRNAVGRLWSRRAMSEPTAPNLPAIQSRSGSSWLGNSVLAGYVALSLLVFVTRWFRSVEIPLTESPVMRVVYGLRLANAYGVFSVMTKSRPEVIVEASLDGEHWEAYEFHWKPGDLTRRPGFIAPWQPRLDWQMWFAALSGHCGDEVWFLSFQQQLLRQSPSVLGLLRKAPFPGKRPNFVRATLWNYEFAPSDAAGIWWQRSTPREYCPSLALNDFGELAGAATPAPRVEARERLADAGG